MIGDAVVDFEAAHVDTQIGVDVAFDNEDDDSMNLDVVAPCGIAGAHVDIEAVAVALAVDAVDGHAKPAIASTGSSTPRIY